MKEFDINDIREFYENVDTVWPKSNKWHDINQKEIKQFIHKFSFQKCRILNAGSGGNNYGLNEDMCHVDIAENKVNNTKNYVICNIENMPFANDSFDAVICVGSVLNYSDAVKAIGEMSRVLQKNGFIILEFECSYSFEFMGTDAFKANAAIITTYYFNTLHKMWVYSLDYITRILRENNLIIKKTYPYHILSTYIYYRNKSESTAAQYACFDRFFRHLPIIRRYSGNVILYAQKT